MVSLAQVVPTASTCPPQTLNIVAVAHWHAACLTQAVRFLPIAGAGKARAFSARTAASFNAVAVDPESSMPVSNTRYRDSLRWTLGAMVAFGLWPWAVGCGAKAHGGNENDEGTSGHAGARDMAGASGDASGAAGAPISGGSSGAGSASGHAEQGGRSFAGESSAGDGGSLGGRSASGGGGASGNAGRAGSGGAAAGGGAVSCVGPTASFPEFNRSCSSAADCALVAHMTNCCGAMLAIAIATSETLAFDRAESICAAQYPACGCAAQGVEVEDGTQVSWSWQAEVNASCDGGSCKAHYAGETFSCGPHTCTDKQYCGTSSGGPVGAEPSLNCVQTTCTDCACLKLDSACSCSVKDGHLFVSCQRA